MKYLGIIPARGGSKSIPLKNIVNLSGKPLIYYTIEAARESMIDDFVVSTDSKEIEEVCEEYDCKVIRRPKELSSDTTPTLPVINNVLEQMRVEVDNIVILQPTSPLRNFSHINDAINIFDSTQTADSLVSVVKVPHNMEPDSLMTLSKSGYLEDYTISPKIYRRQDKAQYLARNGAAIYITKKNNLSKGILNGKIIPYHMNSRESIDIDSREDLDLAEIFMARV